MTAKRPPLWQRLFNAWRHNRRKSYHAIDLTADGFVFTARRRETRMRWADIIQIDAGVKDCFTFDVCYLEFFTADANLYVEELDDGFRQFEFELFQRWPQIRSGWDELLKTPAFKVQRKTLWRRDGAV